MCPNIPVVRERVAVRLLSARNRQSIVWPNRQPLESRPHRRWIEQRHRRGGRGGAGPLAIDTDGSGSIRIPANFCGIFGSKATHGLASILAGGRYNPAGGLGRGRAREYGEGER